MPEPENRSLPLRIADTVLGARVSLRRHVTVGALAFVLMPAMTQAGVVLSGMRRPYAADVYLRAGMVAVVLGMLVGVGMYGVRRMRDRRLRNWLALSLYVSPFEFALGGARLDNVWLDLAFWTAMSLLSGLCIMAVGMTVRFSELSDESPAA